MACRRARRFARSTRWALSLASVSAMGLVLLLPVGASAEAAQSTATQHVAFMTVAQGAALGIAPGRPGPNGTTPVVKPLGIQPDSASGCNQDVCIYVYGQGRFVQEWDTTAYFPNGTESFAIYYLNGSVLTTSNSFYASPGQWYETYWTPEEYFPNNSQVCNSWWANAGHPCETVHS
jgi:hypothetical protein